MATKDATTGAVMIEAVTVDKDVADLFFDSFGITADSIIATVTAIVLAKDYKVAAFCVGCSVQVRNTVSRKVPAEVSKYPIFTISGDRSKAMIRDNINLKALRLCGQVFLNSVKDINTYAQKALAKGNYFTGTVADVTTESGRIISEVSRGFTDSEKTKITAAAAADNIKEFSTKLIAAMMKASGKS